MPQESDINGTGGKMKEEPSFKNFYFFSINPKSNSFDDNTRKQLLSIDNINSIYDTCGYSPLFLIIKAMSLNDLEGVIKFAHQRNIDILPDSISFTVGQNSVLKQQYGSFESLRHQYEFKSKLTAILNIVFFRFPPEKRANIEETIKQLKEDNRVIDFYNIIGEYEFLIKLQVKSISELYSFLDKQFHKKGIQTLTKTIFRIWKDEDWIPEKPIISQYPDKALDENKQKILSILWRIGNQNDIIEAKAPKIKKELERLGGGLYYNIDDIILNLKDMEQQVIYKYSAKLEREGWLKVMVFIKASRKELLKPGIINWLGVTSRKFARKYFLVTGVFDFIILLDCPEIKDLEIAMRDLTEKNKDYIETIRVYPQLPSKSTDSPESLNNQEIAFLKAMMPNSLLTRHSNDSKQEIPREVYYRHFLDENKPLYPNPSFPGFTPTIEILPESMIQTFIRFKILNNSGFDKELITQKNKDGILLKEYRPMHDINTVMFILTTSSFKSLFEFVSALDRYSRNTEISLIFHQDFFKPNIPKKLKCHPCPSELVDFCDACPQYIKQREEINIRDIDCKIKGIESCKVAILQIKSQEGLESKKDIENWLNKAANDDQFKKKIIDLLREAINNGAKLVVYPELTVPKEFIDEIKKEMETIKKRVFVIAGSHYDVDNYNVCPILFSNEDGDVEIRYQHKNNPSQSEESVRKGKGMLRFTNTGFGDFVVLICYDLSEGNMGNALFNTTDILIVPSWEPHPIARAYPNLRDITFTKYCFAFFANNGIYGESGIFTPFKENYTTDLKKIDKGLERIEFYDINILELDMAREIENMDKHLPYDEKGSFKNKYRTPPGGIKPRHPDLHEVLW